MLEKKSRTPVMPWDGMRIDEPGRGPWCENEKNKKKKGKEEWRRKGVADSCYASGWHENRGTRSRTVVEKKKKKKEEWRKKEVPDFCYATRWLEGRGIWSWTVELKKEKEKGQMKGE